MASLKEAADFQGGGFQWGSVHVHTGKCVPCILPVVVPTPVLPRDAVENFGFPIKIRSRRLCHREYTCSDSMSTQHTISASLANLKL